ncbi:ABC-F family ATP-binding cassette domain-containing protein [Coralloluteibacterium stylophorae]|uniref:ABC-F family ATP-binding cassette domain-containing protein n=1 Tax=Coralloluteibacterium stylophorae TaxID=1776034 RepID=A0A8J7VTW9_9GAMM|nr:ABC-F family ATP-binding cassette domain-containing protein [Coralloluteibacterium stylophorae]MBS7455784.1 ABC-F family ATP-binding cassette domain-containing protein [Coralloluteibacterium stylophorae]
MSDPRIRVSHLRFAWADGTPVFEGLSFALGAQRTGLVAPNGAGKSTLLRLIAGELAPLAGQVEVAGRLAYLPQHRRLAGQASVAEVLGIAPTLAALAAIAAGDARQALFNAVGEDWDIAERSRSALARLGLGDVDLHRRMATFSGGEAMALELAAQLLRRPGVLVLDEPSNDLDRNARQRLYRVLEAWEGCLLVASHDRALLARMTQIAELDDGALRIHGGDFDAWQRSVRAEQAATEQDVRGLRQALRREQRQKQEARERAERRAGVARRRLPDAGLPRIVAGGRARSAQVSVAKSDERHGASVAQVRARLDAAVRTLRETPDLDFALPETRVPAGQLLFAGEGLRVQRGGRALYAAPGLTLAIRGPERIALGGRNGAGKSTLLRLLAGELAPDAGTIRRGAGRIAFLPQHLDVLDPARSVLANLGLSAPQMPAAGRSNLLARLRFRGERMHLPVAALSGGERLRAVLACVLHAEPPPRLLLLDEPSNNLDLASVAELEAALRAYGGALVVVSHDPAFVDALAPTRRLVLEDGRLVERV